MKTQVVATRPITSQVIDARQRLTHDYSHSETEQTHEQRIDAFCTSRAGASGDRGDGRHSAGFADCDAGVMRQVQRNEEISTARMSIPGRLIRLTFIV
jgi:hypothetical protein